MADKPPVHPDKPAPGGVQDNTPSPLPYMAPADGSSLIDATGYGLSNRSTYYQKKK